MSIYQELNDKQKEAVFHTRGPLLVLAGAGSGKTRVLMNRIVRLIEEGVSPSNIMAITFTNKAANSMRTKLENLLDIINASLVQISTFHSACLKLLKKHIDVLSYSTNFNIYDVDDQKTIVRKVLRDLDIEKTKYSQRDILSFISKNKNKFISPKKLLENPTSMYEKELASIYLGYENELKKNNSLDFDDLILKAVEVLEKDEDVLRFYQNHFKYIMVDEYQDTNYPQFRFIELLAKSHQNICVVGDDDQSIYKFRGANIYNILNFENKFDKVHTIFLEENYRSKGNILNLANGLIKNNTQRKGKTLFTKKDLGEKITFLRCESDYVEADVISDDILKRKKDYEYSDFAILYRTNAQSRLFEEKLVKKNIPYQIIGGINFYQRKEIKDILAYLKLINNKNDDLSFFRIINTPKRGIGKTSIEKISKFAKTRNLSLFSALLRYEEVDGIKLSAKYIDIFIKEIKELERYILEDKSVFSMIEYILEKFSYKEYLKEEYEDDFVDRIENINELLNKASEYEDKTLREFLDDLSLFTDMDTKKNNANVVNLMTLHSAKGLEFPNVYMVGMDEGLFPSDKAIDTLDEFEIEEERRLCYVGITRAMDKLMLTSAISRMLTGRTKVFEISRFIGEMPKELFDKEIDIRNKPVDVKEYKRIQDSASNYYTSKEFSFERLSKGSNLIKKASQNLDFEVGDKVLHIKFGRGEIKDIEKIDGDYRVSVEFENYGIKRMSLAFAKLKKV